MRDGSAFVREHYLSTCRRAEKLPSDSKKDARMREMFVLNLDWFMATLLEGSVAGGYGVLQPREKEKRGVRPSFCIPVKASPQSRRDDRHIIDFLRVAAAGQVVDRRV